MTFLLKCPSCKGHAYFETVAQHPRGAGHKVPCSRCRGQGLVDTTKDGWR